MFSCPACGSIRIRRSRSRGFVEKLRKTVTHHRPHRCHACGWRGWGPETEPQVVHERSARSERPAPDFSAIDVAVGFERERSRRAGG